MLKLVNIKKTYRVADSRVHALKGINLEFRRNEFVCILGQSGCGKTTLLNIIGGLDQYTSGDLVIQGKSTKSYTDRDWDIYRNHRIGFIFQSYNLIPHQTVLGNVELALTIAGIGKEERKKRAINALNRVGLGNELNKRPNQLSGGQMQRVAIARALVNDPDILLADEPTGALDTATSVQIMELIKEIAGERLVIMVTHNPELAEQYATRIIRLRDGKKVADSNPYDRKAELERARAAGKVIKKRRVQEKKQKASMSFRSSLALSARNLLTKKGRTAVTSFAGSIGIISVCLVLALSNGFNNYILKTEEDMLSQYPLEVMETSLDMTTVMNAMSSATEMPDLDKIGDQVYVNSFLTKIAKGMTVTNNISPKYLEYIEKMDKNLYQAIQYGYGENLSDNLFTSVQIGETVDTLTPKVMSLSELKSYYTIQLSGQDYQYAQLAYLVDYLGGVVDKMPDTAGNPKDAGFGSYIKEQYDVVAGSFPDEVNEAVLVIGPNNDMTDLTLAQLGFIDQVTFLSYFQEEEGEKKNIPFDDVLDKKFTLFSNDAIYTATGGGRYAYSYSGERASLTPTGNEGLEITVSGVLRLKEGLTYGCLKSGLNLTEAIVEKHIENNMQSAIVQWMKNPTNSIQIPYEGKTITAYPSPAEHLNKDYYQYSVGTYNLAIGSVSKPIRALGGDDTVNSIAFYPKNFDAKEQMLTYLDAWNDTHEDGEKITYTDTVGTLMGMVQTMLNAVTYVLVAFTAISLVVSSVMIGIITYVSVVERVKEIGVLRSLGARKRDIKNLFNAETFIIGLTSGVLGVAISYFISLVVNAILQPLTGIVGLASLPFTSALMMVLISVLLTLVSGLIPASAAAKKDPVIALRTE